MRRTIHQPKAMRGCGYERPCCDHAHRAPPVHVLDNVHASRLEQAREEDLKRCLVRVRVR